MNPKASPASTRIREIEYSEISSLVSNLTSQFVQSRRAFLDARFQKSESGCDRLQKSGLSTTTVEMFMSTREE
jgi:hypothetical protein